MLTSAWLGIRLKTFQGKRCTNIMLTMLADDRLLTPYRSLINYLSISLLIN